ncbi:MAG: hypothetical protein A2Z16_11610 [Chloroflexi bacterium RBG_16_54_18]|nr:MAG: hypothetical protein A2Z16_11610 [Chloroflexi bacterium RBG_16_54_18]
MNAQILIGMKSKSDYYDPFTYEIFLQTGDFMNIEIADRMDILDLAVTEAQLHYIEVVSTHQKRWIGLGKYRSHEAITLLKPGSGEKRILGKELTEYVELSVVEAKMHLTELLSIDEVSRILAQMELIIYVQEDRSANKKDTSRQSYAITCSIVDVLCKYDHTLRIPLRRGGYGVHRPNRTDLIKTRIDNLEVNSV